MKMAHSTFYDNHAYRYFEQTQGQMAIMNVERCDFVVFSNGQVVADHIFGRL